MSDTLKIFTDGWEQLTHSPLWLILAVMTLAIGFTLKSAKVFPNRFIPLITLPFCTIAYAMLGAPGDINPTIPYPRVMLGFYGFLDGFLAWTLHRVALKRLEKFCPWLQPVLSEFDSIPPVPLPDGSNVKPKDKDQ